MRIIAEEFSSELSQPEDGTDLNWALSTCLERHDNLQGIALVSDGDWNSGESPVQAASRLKSRNIRLFAVAVGSDTRLPDIELVQLDAPTFGVVAKDIRIPFVVESSLPQEKVVSVTLTPTSGDQVIKQVTLPAMGQLQDAILWRPNSTGDVSLTLEVPAQEEEVVADNNRRSVPISIREEAIKVLLVESIPRWEYRYLRNALHRDPGVDVACLLYQPGLSSVGGGSGYIPAFPTTLEELSQFDVVFLGDVGIGDGELTQEQCQLVKGLVESQASGLIFMPGMLGRHLTLLGSELEPLYPVLLDPAQSQGWGTRIPCQFALTSAGRSSLLTRLENNDADNTLVWSSLPGFQWHAATLRAKVGSQVLATHQSEANEFGRLPLLVTKTYGTGKVLFMGTDAAWRWREGIEDKYHYRFWGQVVRWMAYQRTMASGKNMRLFFSPDRPQVSDLVSLNANVATSSGEPMQDGTVVVRMVAPSGKIESIQLAPQGGQWGLFSGSFTPTEHGRYQVTLSCQESVASLSTPIDVYGAVLERTGRPARFDVLSEITAMTGGEMVNTNQLSIMFEAIANMPDPQPEVRRLRLWCHPGWAGLLISLLAIFWVGRKMNGTI